MKAQITRKSDEAVIVKEGGAIVEISAQIDTQTIEFRARYNSDEIEFHARLLTHENDHLARWVDWKNYITPDAYTAAIKMLHKNLRDVKRDIRNGMKHPAWKNMREIVKRDVKSYQGDFFYHDTLRLARENPNTFVWAVRSTGTWMLSRNGDFEMSIIAYNEKQDFYLIQSGYLHKITHEEAKKAIQLL